MMIKRTELIEKIRAKIQEREVGAVKRHQAAEKEADRAERQYVEDTREAWSKFADRIRLRVRQGLPVTASDVPEKLRSRSGWGETHIVLFKPGQVKASDYQPRTEGFQSLLLVLESSPDELVSTNALERMGAPVKELFQ